MSAIIRIAGYAWLIMTITVTAAGYILIWALDGAPAVVSTFDGGLLGVAAVIAPSIVQVAIATWLDWRRGRWPAK